MSGETVTVSGSVVGGGGVSAGGSGGRGLATVPPERRGASTAAAVRGREPAVGVGPPSLTWEFVGSDLGYQNNPEGIKFRGIGRSGDRLYMIPYGADYVAELDLQDDTTLTGPSVAHIPTGTGDNQYRKWIEAHTAADGRIFANANHAWGHLIIDPSTVPSTVDTVKNNVGDEIGTAMQCRSGAIIEDFLYSMSWNSRFLRVIDTVTGRYDGNIAMTLDRTGPIYQERPNWEAENSAGFYDRFWGVTAGVNGRAHITPRSSDRIGILDAASRTAWQGVDTLTGSGPFPPGSLSLLEPYWTKWTDGAFSPLNECIYHMPKHARSILKSDTNTGRAIEIPLPDELLAIKDPNLTWSFSAVAGPDGLICSVPWSMPYFLWIDPRTDEIGYVEISAELALTGAPGLYFTYGVTVGRSIYLSPAYSRYVGKITFS